MANDPRELQTVASDAAAAKVARRPLRSVVKMVAFAAVIYFFVLPLIPGFRNAAHELRRVSPLLLALGLGLELLALYSYSLLTRTALGESGSLISSWRMFRIQLSTRALSSVVPGGTAAGSALGYRLMTLSGIPGPDAGFALGTAGLGSAVVLNLLFWAGLIISIPLRGVNPGYASAAIAGVLIMGVVAALGVFLQAFGGSVSIDGLIIAFGLANIAAVIPITPGGLGVIEALLISTLVGFGMARSTATLGVASYRLSQFFFPILLGGLSYLSLRLGPWSVERRTALRPLREVATEAANVGESPLDFDERFAPRRPKGDRTRELERQAQLFDSTFLDGDDDAGSHQLY